MKILGIYDGSGPKYHRVLLPCHGLEQHGHVIKMASGLIEKDLQDTDIVFFNRLIGGINLLWLSEMKEKYGFKLVNDMDDHWILGKEHPLYEGYRHHNVSHHIASFIAISDVITVTHERLQAEVHKYFPDHKKNDTVHVLANAIPKIDQFVINIFPSELTRLFWAGGVTHKKDLELLRRPFQLIKRDKVKLVIAGYVAGEPEWKAMAKIYTTDSAYNTQVFESQKVHDYYKAYAHCDISLIPLQDNDFNRCKSNLKILEAANIGAPVIVSRVHPYLDFPENLVNYVDIHRPWVYQINKLLNDPEMMRAQGFGLQAYVDRKFNFNKISSERNQIFNATIEHSKTGAIPAEVGSLAE